MVNAHDFEVVLQEVFEKVEGVLSSKAGEYADDYDRLRNFKQAAHLQQTTAIDALSGMMAKHTVSVYDLMGRTELPPIEFWDEKIIDHINYLILLRALVVEGLQGETENA